MKPLKYIVALLLLTLNSCIKDIELKQDNASDKMVVNSLFDNDRPMIFSLTKSLPIYGNQEYLSVNDATVTLYKDDSLIGQMDFALSSSLSNFGKYLMNQYPEPGHTYKVQITHPTYGLVTAEDEFPPTTNLSPLQFVQIGDSTNNFITKIAFDVTDNDVRDNYYRINVEHVGDEITGIQGSDTLTRPKTLPTRIESITVLSDYVRDSEGLLFSDKKFSGTTQSLVFLYREVDIKNMVSDTLVVHFGKVSKAHYNYFRDLEIYYNGNPGYESVQVTNNIVNGYGIFMSQNLKRFRFKIK